jgi:SAM-dependent methyltransferase
MKFNQEFLSAYVGLAPLPLAIERTMECQIMSRKSFDRPILDIGCGEGLFAKVLFAEPIDTGIDPNQMELDRAKELGAYKKLICCKGDAIPEPDGSYRTVFSNSVMEHIPTLDPVLAESFRLLQPGGHFYMTVPSAHFDEYSAISQLLGALGLSSIQVRYRSFYNRFWAHYHYAEPAAWAERVRAQGFEILEAYSYAPKQVCLLNDLLVPTSLPGFLSKRFTNRWTFLPDWRRIFFAPATMIARLFLHGADRCERGGLVFISARKP